MANRYLYNGKEFQSDGFEGISLDIYDFHARGYDPILGRTWQMDPHAENYYGLSPYSMFANNPIINIDPDGKDWYTDKDGTYQYNPDVKSQEDLQEGQNYVGVTHQIKDGKGNVITDYRKDGSIMFANQTDAYNRMWTQANNVDREQFGIIKKDGVLVLPEYKNENNQAFIEEYGYSLKDSKLGDPVSESTFSEISTIHTHQSKEFDASMSWEDYSTNAIRIPYKMGIVMSYNGNVSGGYSYIDKAGAIIGRPVPIKYDREQILKGADLRLSLQIINLNISRKYNLR
ncbi:MAG: RHS repeat-associated core domain-containing protein [Breznakibacter sp.]